MSNPNNTTAGIPSDLQKIPVEIRAMIFRKIGENPGMLAKLAEALTGDTELRNEVTEVMCKTIPLIVSSYRFATNAHKGIPARVMKNVENVVVQ